MSLRIGGFVMQSRSNDSPSFTESSRGFPDRTGPSGSGEASAPTWEVGASEWTCRSASQPVPTTRMSGPFALPSGSPPASCRSDVRRCPRRGEPRGTGAAGGRSSRRRVGIRQLSTRLLNAVFAIRRASTGRGVSTRGSRVTRPQGAPRPRRSPRNRRAVEVRNAGARM